MANPWDNDPIVGDAAASPSVTPLPMSPQVQAREARDNAAAGRDDIRTGIAAREEGRQIDYHQYDNTLKLRSAYDAMPEVKNYRKAMPLFVAGLKSGNTPQGSNALIYAYATVMDPASSVREGESAGVADSDTLFAQAEAYARKQLEGTGTFSPEARAGLIREMRTKTIELARSYDQTRQRYEADAQAFGIDPERVIGQHDAAPFVEDLQAIDKQEGRLTDAQQRQYDEILRTNPGATNEQLKAALDSAGLPVPANLPDITTARDQGRGVAPASTATYEQSPVSQTMSGVNEGIADTFGIVRDLPDLIQTGMVNGANALFGSSIPTPGERATERGWPALGGGEWWREKFGDWGLTGAEPSTGSGRFLRRAGQSVGAAAVPVGAGASTLRGMGAGLLSAFGGGAGAAASREAFPNNPAAEMTGEMLGGFATGGALASLRQAATQRGINAAVPTVPQLREQAGDLYRQAETRGITADPTQTTQLADDFRATLRREGQLGPNGRITDAPSSTNKSLNLIEQYEGGRMAPTEMDTVRGVLAEGRTSVDGADRRLAGLLTDQFDDWARPLAPEFDQARDVASRYLQAEDLGRARELAGAQASQFSGSGFENALRTQYRGLDRNIINERSWFTPEVTDAIRTLSRGTPLSNAARNLGKLAPTGVVSAALGTGGPAMAGYALGGPAAGLAVGTGAAALGTAGRVAATRMGIKAADNAELIARNGGPVAQAPMLDPEAERLALALIAQQATTGQATHNRRRGIFGAP